MEKFQINNGIIINLLEYNIIQINHINTILYKIFYKIKIFKFQMNGAMKLLMNMIILKQCYRLEIGKYLIKSFITILNNKIKMVKLLQCY